MPTPRQITDLTHAVGSDAFWFAGTECDLSGRRGSDTLWVTFDNLATIDQRPETRPWPAWLAQRARRAGVSLLGVQSHRKDWYRNAETPDLIEALQAAGYFAQFSRVLFLGASMGGFAALNFAGLVPGARVLAFSPQSTLNRDIAPFETRYKYAHRRFDWQSPAYLDAAGQLDGIAGGHILFDPFVPEDRQHAARLRHARIGQVKIPHAGHLLIRVVVKAGALEPLLDTYPMTGAIPPAFWSALRKRRANRTWARSFLAQLEARGDGPLLRRACHALSDQYDYRFARLALERLEAA